MVCVYLDGPKRRQIGQTVKVPMTGPYSIRRAIKEAKPTAVLVGDLIKPAPLPPCRSRLSAWARTCIDTVAGRKQRLQVDTSVGKKTAFVAFMGLMQVIQMQAEYAFTSISLSPEPKTQTEARKRSDYQDWIKAEWVEMDTVYGMGTIQFIPLADVPVGMSLIPTKFAYKCKFGDCWQIVKKKARLCVRGDLQTDDECTETFAPTSRFNTLRLLIATAVQQQLKLVQFDVRGAFMVSGIDDKDLYIQLPKGYEAPEGFVARLARSLYGLRDSAFRFHKTLSDWMCDYGFTPLNADRTMFKLERNGATIIVALYVDDGLCAHDSDVEYGLFIDALAKRFELSAEATEVSWYLGVAVERDWEKGTLKLTQQQYVKDLLARFNMTDCNTVLTAMEVGQRLTSEDCPATPDKEVIKQYQQLVGSLNYLVAWTFPELAYLVSQCARFMANPGPSHVAAAKRILRYAKGVKNNGIVYTRNSTSPNQLYGYVDADHAGDTEGRQSVTGFVVMMNGGPVSWESKRQVVTALSSAEAEYYAASAIGCEIAFLRRILESMGFEQHAPTPVAEDNVACIYMSRSSAMYHKSKHINVRVYRLREFVQDGILELYHVASSEQAADLLTKSLPSPAASKHRETITGHVGPGA
mmetsp:Transcript_49639/g.101360  ORF Transcript_49639/g.101360 Transcript_49639/m.101360 type:complete len:638 (-) Transcript_49639:44-1957(-)